MPIFLEGMQAARRGLAFCATGCAMAAAGLMATNAGAAVLETLSSSTSYTYDLVPGLPGLNSGSDSDGTFHIVGANPNQATDIKMAYGTIAAPDASFFFLHNIQCQGYCSVGVTTFITDTITNTGPSTVNLRLDSDITAGHLGLVQNARTNSAGIFQFDITQTMNGIDHGLYQALGQISSNGASINTSDGSIFNNLTSYHDPAQTGLDWDLTDLSVLLDPLAPGETATVTYRSITYLNAFGTCTNVDRCDGVQVAFGDPRNNGGIIGTFALSLSPQSFVKQPVGWVLNRGFDMATVKMQIVNLSDVPEPASWAMMIIGFGMTGLASRRRHARPRLAAA